MGITKRGAAVALATAAAAASLTAVTAQPASAISRVACGNRHDFLAIEIHETGLNSHWECYARGGTWDFSNRAPQWVTRINTGNNRVQWFGDGRWQPAKPIGKWTFFTWPHQAGGVRIEKIRIV